MKSHAVELCGALLQVPLFQNLNATECRQLSEIMQTVSAAPGELIVKQGQMSQALFILTEGKCRVLRQLPATNGDHSEIVLATLEPYQHFGEMSFFHAAPHSASVRAEVACKLAVIRHADYADLIEDGASAAFKLAYNCVHTLAERLRQMDAWVADLLSDGADAPKSSNEWTRFRDKLFRGLNL